ncbi:MAG TPA: tetratricopeptide repeat protein [Bryobacteraceae bacterium]|nr:tetratricopeptide repeat protein [Bryobacteraceae bacterium]
MKCKKVLFTLAPVCAILFATGCSQSPEKLLAAANKYHDNKQYKEASILYQKVLVKDKTNAEAYYRQGLNWLDQGRYGEAVGPLRRAIDLKPSNTDAEMKLAEIYLSAYSRDPKRFKNLLPDIQDLNAKILQHDPNSFNGLKLQGLLQLTDKKYDQALTTFAKANKIKPYARDLMGWYAETLVQQQRSDEAIAVVKDMLTHDKTWGPGYDFLFVMYNRAKQPDNAEQILRQHVQNDPANGPAISNLATFLLANNRFSDAEAAIRKVLDDKKNFPAGHEMVGDFYVRAKKYDQALGEYRLGQKEDPTNALKYQEREVQLHAFTGKADQSLQLARELALKNPKDLSANEMYASLLLQSGTVADAKKSLEELKKLAANNPTDPVLRLDLARAHFGLNDREKALSEALEALHGEEKATKRSAVMVPARTILGRIYEDRGDHAKAMEQATLVLAVQPGNPDATLIRSRALIGTNESDKAQPELEALVTKFPQMNEARLQLGSLYANQRVYDKAQQQFEAVANAKPPDIRGFLGLQSVKMGTGKSAEAIHALQDLADKNPTVLAYRFELANFESAAAAQEAKANPEHSKQLLQLAADNYKEILKTSANPSEVWLRLGVTQRQLEQYEPALASFEQAGYANPKNPMAFLNQGLLNDFLGRKKEASDAYTRVLAVDNENAIALNNLAFLNADSGSNLDQALTFAQRAQKKAPNSPDVSDTLGYVYYRKDLNGEALRIFRQIVAEHPQNPTFRFHLAMALLKQGDKQGARDEAQKALSIAVLPDQQTKIRSFVSQIG